MDAKAEELTGPEPDALAETEPPVGVMYVEEPVFCTGIVRAWPIVKLSQLVPGLAAFSASQEHPFFCAIAQP